MTILTPGLALVGLLAAVGVPLLIHLLFRRRYRVVPWAAIRFLLTAERRRNRRLEQWLLLVLRVLALGLPLVAMAAATDWAEPWWQHLWPSPLETVIRTPRTHHIVVVDGSLSMNAKHASGRTCWEQAQQQALRLLDQAGAGDAFSLIFVGEGVEAVVPGPSTDVERVAQEVTRLSPTHGMTPLAAALPLVQETLDRSPPVYPRKQITFLTDLQRSAWQGILRTSEEGDTASEAWQRLVPRADLIVIDSGPQDTENLSVAELRISEAAPLVHSPVHVSAVVANHGRQERRNVLVQLFVARPGSDYQRPAAGEQIRIDVLPAGGSATVVFGQQAPLRFSQTGPHLVVVEVTSGDVLEIDDRRGLVVPVRASIPVVLVEGRPEAQGSRRTAGDLQRALLPEDGAGEWTPARPRTLTVTEFLDPALGTLDDVAAVYLCDVPLPAPDWIARLDAFARRGGTIIIGLGPQVASHLREYNRVLYQDGQGLLPFPLEEVVSAAPQTGFRLAAEEEAFRQPLLAIFRDERVRGGLIGVPFRRYIRVRPKPDSGVQRWLDFVLTSTSRGNASRDPALLEWRWRRGRVFLFTSSFNEDWNDWPPLPTYLPFHQELLRYAAVPSDQHTLTVGDTLEEFFPLSQAGLSVRWLPPSQGGSRTLRLIAEEDVAVVRIRSIARSGLHRLVPETGEVRLFWFNPPTAGPSQHVESDLNRLSPPELARLQPLQVVTDASSIRPSIASGASITVAPRPRGPTLARWLAVMALLVLSVEMIFAWRCGPARIASAFSRPMAPAPRVGLMLLQLLVLLLPLAVIFVLAIAAAAEFHGTLPEWLPTSWRQTAEQLAGIPEPIAGESCSLRLERPPLFSRQSQAERWTLLAMTAAFLAGTLTIYRLEQRAAHWSLMWLPALLRSSAWALLLLVVLLQWSAAVERSGWPDLVVLIDTSRSMNHTDDFKDPQVRSRVEALLQNSNSSSASRLQLVQRLLTDPACDGIGQLLRNYQVRLHVFSIDRSLRSVTEVEEEAGLSTARQSVAELQAEGDASHLGDGIQAILKAFRGAPLAGIVVFTDGIITAGTDWQTAAQEAAEAGVPLYLVGIGDVWEAPDLVLSDLQSEDSVTVGDRLVFEARLSLRGSTIANSVPVILYEKEKGSGRLVELARMTANPGAGGAPVSVTLSHIPTTAGEKTYVLQVPPLPGEIQLTNNRLERTVWVTEAHRIRVLLIDGRPRYDFRFLKVLLERESDRSLGGRGFELEAILLNASQGWAATDRSAFRGDFPTRDQLFRYDVVILGDIDPRQLPHASRSLQDIAEFVTGKGGGLLFLSGSHFTPAAWADTPLGTILPVIPAEASTAAATDLPASGFRLRLTELGQQHPALRLSPDQAESQRLWEQLPALYWHVGGYRRKPQAIVLATVSTPATQEQEPTPLITQMFAGSGTVLFLGFDDIWRWRWRQQEEHFDRFWLQTVRFLARSRVRRPELRVVPKAEFRRDETMKVVVRFPVEAAPPSPQQPVRVTVVRRPLTSASGTPTPNSDETQTLTLARVAGPLPHYETVLSRVSEGEYHFTLSDPESPPGQPPPTALVRVLPPWSELDRLDIDRRGLQEAAARSRGRFFTLADVDALWHELPAFPRVPLHQSDPPVPLWNRPVLYLLLLLLLSSEWLLRKLARLL